MLLPPIGSPESLSGLTSYRPHPRRLVAPPRKYFFENGTFAGSSSTGRMLPSCSAAREHDLVADRQVVAAVNRQRVVVERAGQERAGLLGVKRDLIAAMGVQHAVRRRMLQIEADRVQRAVLAAGSRVEAERDEVVAQCRDR